MSISETRAIRAPPGGAPTRFRAGSRHRPKLCQFFSSLSNRSSNETGRRSYWLRSLLELQKQLTEAATASIRLATGQLNASLPLADASLPLADASLPLADASLPLADVPLTPTDSLVRDSRRSTG